MRVMEKQLCNPDRPCKFHREATGLAIAPINLRAEVHADQTPPEVARMQDQPRFPLTNDSDRRADASMAELLLAVISSNRGLSSLMEAHDVISSEVAKRAGFNGIRATDPSLVIGHRGEGALWNHSVDAVGRVVHSTERRAFVARLQLPASQPCTPAGMHSRTKGHAFGVAPAGSGRPSPISIKSPVLLAANACIAPLLALLTTPKQYRRMKYISYFSRRRPRRRVPHSQERRKTRFSRLVGASRFGFIVATKRCRDRSVHIVMSASRHRPGSFTSCKLQLRQCDKSLVVASRRAVPVLSHVSRRLMSSPSARDATNLARERHAISASPAGLGNSFSRQNNISVCSPNERAKSSDVGATSRLVQLPGHRRGVDRR